MWCPKDLRLHLGVLFGAGLAFLKWVPGLEKIWFSPLCINEGFTLGAPLIFWFLVSALMANRVNKDIFSLIVLAAALPVLIVIVGKLIFYFIPFSLQVISNILVLGVPRAFTEEKNILVAWALLYAALVEAGLSLLVFFVLPIILIVVFDFFVRAVASFITWVRSRY